MHTLAAQSRSGLGRTGQGWSAVGLGCAIIFSVINTGLGLCYITLSLRAKLCSIYAQDMAKQCLGYAKTMPDISQRYDQKLYLVLIRLGWGYATQLYPREPVYSECNGIN